MKPVQLIFLILLSAGTGLGCDSATFATVESGEEVLEITEDRQYLHYLADASQSNVYSLSVDTSGSYLFEILNSNPATVDIFIDFGSDSSNADCNETDGQLRLPCTVSLDDTAVQIFTITSSDEVRYTLRAYIPPSE